MPSQLWFLINAAINWWMYALSFTRYQHRFIFKSNLCWCLVNLILNSRIKRDEPLFGIFKYNLYIYVKPLSCNVCPILTVTYKIILFLKKSEYLHEFHYPIRKHAYWNILKILPPKNWKFSDKNLDIFHISAQEHRLWVPVRTASARRF